MHSFGIDSFIIIFCLTSCFDWEQERREKYKEVNGGQEVLQRENKKKKAKLQFINRLQSLKIRNIGISLQSDVTRAPKKEK